MKNKVLKIVVTIALIIAITFMDFIFLGMNLITYALRNEENATNHENVKFIAYFKTAEGEKETQAEYEINNDDMKLYIEVAVENEGTFEGAITLKDSNFKFKTNVDDEAIKKIDNNTITLNSIKKGNSIELELGIEPIIEESYDINMLSKTSVLQLTGEYEDNEEKVTEISSNKEVTLSLLQPANVETSLEAEVITNGIYTVENAKTKIVQVELSSKVIEDVYPIRSTSFEVNVPTGVKNIEVISKGTYASNGESEKELENFEYDDENNLLKIKIENPSKDGKVSWKKGTKDIILVTLKLDENQEIEEKYTVKSIIEFYGESQSKEKSVEYSLTELASGIITTSIENQEEIYKGKLYSGEAREYKTTTNIEINYANLISESVIEESTIYKTEQEDKETNIEYKTTIISKAEFDKILGEGNIVIKDQNKNEIITVTKDTEVDEDKNIVINYESGVKGLIIEMTGTMETGIIRLNHTKEILEEASREEIAELKSLVEQTKVIYNNVVANKEEKTTPLLETTSEVGLTLNKQTIHAESEKEELQIAITLKTDNEKYELYQNPVFILAMPEGVTVDSVSNGTISATNDDLTISKLEPIDQNKIRVEVAGEQQKYVTSNINTQISFTANVKIEKLMANRTDIIRMQYLNKDKKYAVESAPLNIVASNSKIVTHLQVDNYNGEGKSLERYSDRTEEVKGKLPVENTEPIKAPVKYTIINNYDSAVQVMAIIVANYIDHEGNKKQLINYAETEAIVEAGKMYTIEKTMEIPAELYFCEEVTIETATEYTYSGTQDKKVNNITLVTEDKQGFRESTIVEDKLQVETFAQLGDGSGVKETDKIYNEQIIKYIIQVTNISNEPISNLKVTNVQDNGNIYDLKEVEVINWVESSEIKIEHREEELDENSKTFNIDTLNPGESKELICRVVVKKVEASNITTANISISADGIQKQKVQEITNSVQDAKFKISTRKGTNEEVSIYASSTMLMLSTISNLTNEDIKNETVRIYLSEGLYWEENESVYVGDIEEADSPLYNSEENYIEFKIPEIKAGEKIIVSTMLFTRELPMEETVSEETVYLKIDNIFSNDMKTEVKQIETELEVIQKVNVKQEQKLKNGDVVTFRGEISNIGAIDTRITIADYLPDGVEPTKITIYKNGEWKDYADEKQGSVVLIDIQINKGEKIIIHIEATINTPRITTESIENTIMVSTQESTVNSNVITLNIESDIDNSTGLEKPEEEEETPDYEIPDVDKPEDEGKPGEEKPDEEKPGEEKPEDGKPDEENKGHTISGYAWIDLNENEIIDNNEGIKDVIVKLIDVNNKNTFLKDENGKDIEVKTDANGKYTIDNILEGKYNIIFKYDVEKYELKTSETLKDYIIQNTNEKVAITSNINLNSNQTIDLQLVELTKFDLKIDKYISKVIVQTAKETKTSGYVEKQLVREEIQSKYLSGATVLVEYTMQIRNIGELAGYVTEITDYLPNDMTFYSELNTQWYKGEDGNIYNTSLASEVIQPGEIKTVKLTLLKTMSKNNTGTTANIVEISGTMNSKEYVDINLNNNQSKAEIIINPSTGVIIVYLTAMLSSTVIIAVGMYIIKKKVVGKESI